MMRRQVCQLTNLLAAEVDKVEMQEMLGEGSVSWLVGWLVGSRTMLCPWPPCQCANQPLSPTSPCSPAWQGKPTNHPMPPPSSLPPSFTLLPSMARSLRVCGGGQRWPSRQCCFLPT